VVEAHEAVLGLDAGGHRDGAGRRIGDLRIRGIGLRGCEIRERLPGQHVGLAVHAALLPLEDPGGGNRREPHAVAHHQNDILGLVGIARLRQDALQRRLALLEIGIVDLNQLGIRGKRP
jgi:hypothetical protein